MIRVLFISVLAFFFAGSVSAEPQIMSAPEAAAAVTNGEMILIDIRSPGEWAETGVAQGAMALTMHSPDFPQTLTAILNADHGRTIGLICATGGRTGYVTSILEQNGFSDVVDVSEGMIGNELGPGWIARGMPLITTEEAQAAYRQFALAQ